MYIIVVYDISDIKIQSKIRNYLRKYLNHLQLSVFEGEVSKSQYKAIELYLEKIVKNKELSVVIFKIRDQSRVFFKTFGKIKENNTIIY